MDRNVPNSKSPLLLNLPKSMLSFSDMSGDSFLIPVAADTNVVGPMQVDPTPEKQEDNTKVPQVTSVCQLEQPLLMRRSSSPDPKATVPFSESNFPSESADGGQTLYTGLQTKPLVSSAVTSSENNENMNWSCSSVPLSVGQAFQPTPIFTGSPNLQPQHVNQPIYPQSVPISHESNNLRHQPFFPPPQTTFSNSNSFSSSSTPILNTLPTYSETSNYCTVSSHEYYSQPPVITPSAAPVYYNTGKSISQTAPPVTYSSVPHSESYNMNPSSSMPSEMYSRLYEPISPNWLFQDIVEGKEVWCGFSTVDSHRLEMAFQHDPQAIVPVYGGRYDAILTERIIQPVYFEAKSLKIRRSTWFYCSETSQRFLPFPEDVSNIIEQHYSNCVTTGQWRKQVNIPNNGMISFENPQLILFYKNENDTWPALPDTKINPTSVRRSLPDGFEILENENNHIDHLVFIVQGIGSFCDLRFRTVTECVDGFRDIANKMISSHFKQEVEKQQVARVEFLPLAWHAKLHTSDKGFDRRMRNITLSSIPKLRHFTNDTLLDILLYSSPSYCQSILDTVASELNKLYDIFLKRNPNFSGKVFVAGHSLGSLILLDILAHQQPKDKTTIQKNELISDTISALAAENVPSEADTFPSIVSLLQACQLEEYTELFEKEKIDVSTLALLSNDDLKELGIATGPRKRLLNAVHSNQVKRSSKNFENAPELILGANSQDIEEETEQNLDDSESLLFPNKTSPCMQSIIYPKLIFEPSAFFALGSPISMFLTVRGYDRISEDFRLPTCPNFFHIFHPYDPVAFRIEPLIDPNFSAEPMLIPHHKGRKRIHLEIQENLKKFGNEFKQKVIEKFRSAWNSLNWLGDKLVSEVDKLVSEQISVSTYEQQAPSETSGEDIQIGSLNGGRRIDYVLQEKPLEAFNDYLFTLSSHATYWDSEDTVLMILREIYATDGIVASSQSNVENKPLSHPEQSSSNFNPYAFEGTRAESVPNISPFYNVNLPTSVPASSQSMQMFNNFNAPVPQATFNMTSPSTTSMHQQDPPPPLPSVTATQEPLGPPPLTGFIKKSPFTR